MKKEEDKLSAYLSTAIGAARIAGAEALSQMKSIKCSLKNGDEVVTQADRICQDLIINYIRKSHSSHGFIAEEGDDGSLLKIEPINGDAWWVIDPIDGTNNYSHKVLSFSISIGLFIDGNPVLGVIYAPACDTLFTGVVGQGAFCDGVKIDCGMKDVGLLESIAIDSYWDDGIPAKLIELINQSHLRNFGSTALHLAYVASGGFVGAVINRNKLWDFAAGAAILFAAGAKITDQNGNELFPINLSDYEGGKYKFVAANPTTHQKIIDSLK